MSYDLKDEEGMPVRVGLNGKCKGPEVEKARDPKEKGQRGWSIVKGHSLIQGLIVQMLVGLRSG